MTPILLLHGFAGDVVDWSPVLSGDSTFAEPLFGHRGCPEAALTSFDGEVDRIATVCRSRGLDGLHVVGYSLGGRLALGLLIRYPGLCTGATLVGGQPGLSSAAERAERRRADSQWSALLDREGLDPFFDRWQAQPLFASQARFSEQVAARRHRLRNHHSARGLSQAMESLGLGNMPDLWPALPTVKVPIRLVAGDADAKFRALAAEMARALPNAEQREVPSCGHNPLLERPQALRAILQHPFQGRR